MLLFICSWFVEKFIGRRKGWVEETESETESKRPLPSHQKGQLSDLEYFQTTINGCSTTVNVPHEQAAKP